MTESSSMKYCPLCGKEYRQGDTCPADGATLIRARPGSDSLIGTVLKGSYRIEEQIGEGGMGAVYRAIQMPLGRDVAVKVLSPSVHAEPSIISRFFQEARLLSQLSHPNVVGIFDFGNTESGTVFMVMEHLTGRTVGELIPKGSGLPLGEAVKWMKQACAGVRAAHERGLVHRDLKPDNLFVTTNRGTPDTLKVLDFGIARALEGSDATRLTQAGLLMGTPGFIAPEQIQSPADAGVRSDVYALGAILFFMVTGHKPYHGQTPHSVLVQQMQRPPQLDLGMLASRPALAEVIAQAMAIDPEKRLPSTDALADALDTVDADGDGDGSAPTVLMSQPAPPRGRRGPSRRALLALTGVIVAGAIVAGVIVLVLGLGRPGDRGDAAIRSAAGGAIDPGITDPGITDPGITDPGVTESTIRVGMSAAFSGPAKELGRGMRTGIEVSFREINANGGIHGRKLELIALDDAYEPDRAVSNMIDLLHERRVFAVLGNVGTPTAEVTVPLAREQRVPFFGAFSGAALLRREPPDRFVFNYRASYAEETAALIDYFLDQRGFDPSEIAVFAQDDGYGDAGYEGVQAALARRGYAGDVPRVGYRRNTLALDGAVEGIRRQRASVAAIVMAATYRPAATFIRRLVDEGIEPVFANLSFVGSRALAEEMAALGPRYADGVIVSQVVPHPESSAPGVARYRELMARHAPAEQPGFVSLEGFLAAEVFVETLRRSGESPTVASFLTATETLRMDLGIGTELAFDPQRHQASSRVWGTVIDASGQYVELALAEADMAAGTDTDR